MEDRFSFRCWDKIHSKMRKIWSINRFSIDTCDASTGNFVLKPDDCIMMQCTGLKDKNDNLIYEGDILKLAAYGFDENKIFGIVEWEYDGYCVTYIKKINGLTGTSLGDWNKSEIEVVGNKYENPELLEVQNAK